MLAQVPEGCFLDKCMVQIEDSISESEYFWFDVAYWICAAVIVVISVKFKLAMTLDEFGILACVCVDVPWRLCNNVQPIMFLTSLTAASMLPHFFQFFEMMILCSEI